MYNLTESQKDLLRWLVKQVKSGSLTEEFVVIWVMDAAIIVDFKGSKADLPDIRKGALDALYSQGFLFVKITHKPARDGSLVEKNRRCTLLGKAYEAVESNFAEPDTSFVKHLTPLADITNLDSELKTRCLPMLGAGSNEQILWDSAIRTAGVILEERLRKVGNIQDPNQTSRQLVNAVFGKSGSLASRFEVEGERDGYRDLFAGMIGVFRNPSAHKFIDPTPEDGGAFIVFVNLLLKRLEDFQTFTK